MAFQIQFPDPNLAEDDGLVAVGGNLSVEFLLSAYRQGLFPWYNAGEPILWWSPNPRMVLFPSDLKVSKSLDQIIKRKKYSVMVDKRFEEVIRQCSAIKRKDQRGTWITPEMIEAYLELHRLGFAHSVETYSGKELVGGLYGVSLGRVFFGESMFYIESNASKVALYYLVQIVKYQKFEFIDVQQSTAHLRRMGAKDIKRFEFLDILKRALKVETLQGKWNFHF